MVCPPFLITFSSIRVLCLFWSVNIIYLPHNMLTIMFECVRLCVCVCLMMCATQIVTHEHQTSKWSAYAHIWGLGWGGIYVWKCGHTHTAHALIYFDYESYALVYMFVCDYAETGKRLACDWEWDFCAMGPQRYNNTQTNTHIRSTVAQTHTE